MINILLCTPSYTHYGAQKWSVVKVASKDNWEVDARVQ